MFALVAGTTALTGQQDTSVLVITPCAQAQVEVFGLREEGIWVKRRGGLGWLDV